MNERVKCYLSHVYRILLRGYPPGYRGRFADEMLAAFQAAQSEAARIGFLALLRLWLRELRDWPACVLRQRLAEGQDRRGLA